MISRKIVSSNTIIQYITWQISISPIHQFSGIESLVNGLTKSVTGPAFLSLSMNGLVDVTLRLGFLDDRLFSTIQSPLDP